MIIIFSVCPPPSVLLLMCFIFWWFRLQALGNVILPNAHFSVMMRHVVRELWLLSQEHIVILEVACVCLTRARVSWSSSATPLALVYKEAMTDGDPSSRHVKPPAPSPQPSPHIPVLIYEDQDEHEGCVVMVALVKWSDFSYLDDANLSWSRRPG